MITADIIILAFIAGFILYKLYITIGKRDDDQEINNIPAKEHHNIIDISSMVKNVDDEVPKISLTELELSKGFEDVVAKIKKLDESFKLEKFLEGAKKAFELILNAFAKNDRQTLESLLDNNIYNQFISEINKRVENKITLNLTLVALPKIQIRDIRLVNNIVSIDVFYNSQQITILKDSDNNIIEGNASQIDNVEDYWTYNKELNLTNNWLLVKVNAAEDS